MGDFQRMIEHYYPITYGEALVLRVCEGGATFDELYNKVHERVAFYTSKSFLDLL